MIRSTTRQGMLPRWINVAPSFIPLGTMYFWDCDEFRVNTANTGGTNVAHPISRQDVKGVQEISRKNDSQFVPFNLRALYQECEWDGGDCCICTCVDGDFTCGEDGFDCRDPNGSSSSCGTLMKIWRFYVLLEFSMTDTFVTRSKLLCVLPHYHVKSPPLFDLMVASDNHLIFVLISGHANTRPDFILIGRWTGVRYDYDRVWKMFYREKII